MKVFVFSAVAITVLLSGSVNGENNVMKWSGYLLADNRLEAKKELGFSWNEYRLNFIAEIKPVPPARLYSEIWLRSLGFPDIHTSRDLENRHKLRPIDLDLREAYLDLYGVFYENLDLRIGRQRIAWGTGDKINPTDNLNPLDLEDIWDFGRRLGSDAAKASLFMGSDRIYAVLIPMFTPSVLPSGDFDRQISSRISLPPGLILHNYSDRVILPENNLFAGSKAAAKYAGRFFDYDFSLSYCHGPDNMPIMNRVTVVPIDTLGAVDIAGELIYPNMHIIGCDLAGQIAGAGAWAELAVFLPEEVVLTTDLSAIGMGEQSNVVLKQEPYPKLLLGADYTFPLGLYLNLQYLRGFIYERGNDNLKNYVMLGSEWRSLNDRLKIMPIAGSLEFGDLDEFADTYAFVYAPEINYSPAQNAVLTAGLRVIHGADNSTFGILKDRDEVFFKVKCSF